MSKPGRVVLDTNIWVSYIIGGQLDEIAHLILDNNIQVYSCRELEEELKDVLKRDKFKSLLQFEHGVYVDFIRNLTLPVSINRIFNECPDEKDNYLFDLAIQSESAYLITGDKLLLRLNIKKLQIVTLKASKEGLKSNS